MDPHLEEYRREQRGKPAASAAISDTACRQNLSFALAVAVLFITMLVAVSLQQAPQGALAMVIHAAGACPQATGTGICVEECSSDAQCRAEGKLCCSNGCGHVCMTPVDPNTPPPAVPCTLMIVPVSINDSAKLIMQVPTPENHSVLQGVGILILYYGKGRDGDCCRAQDWLSAADTVKSVEYDGPPPACPSPAPPPEVDLEPKPQISGGWSTGEKVGEEDLEVWNQVLAKTVRYGDVELDGLGEPVTVSRQVVAGINYKFTFSDGSVVEVFSQPWTDTIEVTDVTPGSDSS